MKPLFTCSKAGWILVTARSWRIRLSVKREISFISKPTCRTNPSILAPPNRQWLSSHAMTPMNKKCYHPSSIKSLTKQVGDQVKKNIHPKVRQVVFKDISSDFSFLGTSTMDSKETTKWKDGKSYPLIRLEISSASHPFFTGKQRVHDAEGRIARFKKK